MSPKWYLEESYFLVFASRQTSQAQQPNTEQRQRRRFGNGGSFSWNDPELLLAIGVVAPRSVELVVVARSERAETTQDSVRMTVSVVLVYERVRSGRGVQYRIAGSRSGSAAQKELERGQNFIVLPGSEVLVHADRECKRDRQGCREG